MLPAFAILNGDEHYEVVPIDKPIRKRIEPTIANSMSIGMCTLKNLSWQHSASLFSEDCFSMRHF